MGGAGWHARSLPELYRELDTGGHGLTEVEAGARLATNGPNQLAEAPPTSGWAVLARQFASPLIYILLVAAAVTVALAEYIDAAVIGAVLLLNATIGFTQERRAENAVRSLMGLVVPRARVVRDGKEREIDSRSLVPGDLILLEPGARVPADVRLVATNVLRVDESLLTGESVPVDKDPAPVDAATGLADRRCMAYTGSIVTSGRGGALVVATAGDTELGAIAGMIRSEASPPTPLQRRMDRFAVAVGLAVAAACVVAFASGVALGEGAGEMFLVAVALAVAAIPEGLPVVITITLALGVRRMARRNAIVRWLPAVETLGSTTVIGTDKTGTLTENRMTVQRIWTARGDYDVDHGAVVSCDDRSPVEASADPALHLTLLAGVLANEAEAYRTGEGMHVTGDPTEAALLVSAMAAGMEPEETRIDHPLVSEVPFEPELRYSASVRRDGNGEVTFVKGAPEALVAMCGKVLGPDGPVPIDPALVLDRARELASAGLRVLAMARSLGPVLPADDGADDNLVLVGMQAMMDPPRDGVAEAVATCRGAGIRVVMITGDHALTAAAVAAQLGIGDAAGDPGVPVVTGAELDSASDEELFEQVGRVSVYARIAPAGKLRIVRALQARGEVVAVTGDGMNDAPALKAAAIGVAMGRGGTDVAREASDMVLADDNFVSIAAAVEEGRVTFDNIRKVTFFLVSAAVATISAILVGVWAGWPLVMVPAQLLWLNLVTNGLQDVALAFEPGEQGLLRRRPRRPGEGVLSPLLWERTLLSGGVMAAGTLLLFNWELDRTGSQTLAQTTALTTMVVFMALHVGNVRSESTSLLRLSPLSNPFLAISTVSALAVHAASLYLPPTQFVLRVEPLEAVVWARILAVALTVVIAVELHKVLRRRHPRGRT